MTDAAIVSSLPSLAQSARFARLKAAQYLLIFIGLISLVEAIVAYRINLTEVDRVLTLETEEIRTRGYAIDEGELAQTRLRMRKVAHVNFVIFMGQSLVYFLCGLLIARAPVALPLLALILYVASWAIFSVMDPAHLFQTIIIKLIVIPFLLRICQTGYAFTQAEKSRQGMTTTASLPGRPLGFVLVLLAYGTLLFSTVATFLLLTLQTVYDYRIDETVSFLASNVFSAALVIMTLWLCWPVPSLPIHPQSLRRLTWLMAAPLVAASVALSIVYTSYVNQFFEVPATHTLGGLFAQNPAYILTFYCLIPAVYEEFFFRKAFLGYVVPMTNPHAAIWLVATAFGLSHLAQVFSMPYLIIAGALFGYLRYYSGSMWLPIIAHTLHNAAIFLWQFNQSTT